MAGTEQVGLAAIESGVHLVHQGIVVLLSSVLVVSVMAVVLVALSAILRSAHRL